MRIVEAHVSGLGGLDQIEWNEFVVRLKRLTFGYRNTFSFREEKMRFCREEDDKRP